MGAKRNWTKEETMLAFELYCTIPAGQDTINNSQIISLAQAIGRTPSSVKLKLQNFKSYDPSYTNDGRIGLSHGSKLDKEICDEFLENWDELVFRTYEIKKRFTLSENINILDDEEALFVGCDASTIARRRIGHSFFRNTLLASYNKKCCVTGINILSLLRASHIKPWALSNDINEKANPQNGLLLNALHDAAFDKGYITITPKYVLVVSGKLSSEDDWSSGLFTKYNGVEIQKPNKFLPSKVFIEYHNDVIFKG